jgi:hypothetical protein
MLPTSPAITRIWSSLLLAVATFAVLMAAIGRQPVHTMGDFDQPFYITIAYDLDRHGVFSNGIFDKTDSTQEAPPPGMFFGPVYPLLVLAGMKIDPAFDAAVACSVASRLGHRDEATCAETPGPMRIFHALLLTLATVAIALAGRVITGRRSVFWLAGTLAAASFAAEAEIFAYIMTEAVTVALYSLFALCTALAWKTSHIRYLAFAGLTLGALCLTRPSYIVLLPVVAILIVIAGRWLKVASPGRRPDAPSPWRGMAAFLLAAGVVIGPWMLRNQVMVGKFGLTQEYGAAALIERFAYNSMTVREFFQAFPYCTPGLGDLAFDLIYGTDSMHRFVYHTTDSFFHVGRGRRDTLVREHGSLDPLISGIVQEEMRNNWWRHLLVSIPLAWCGMWAGWMWGFLTIPLFGWACVRAIRRSRPLLVLYAAPAVVMLGLHAAVANESTRYNLILIGPFAIGAASILSGIISAWLSSARWRSRVLAPEP